MSLQVSLLQGSRQGTNGGMPGSHLLEGDGESG